MGYWMKVHCWNLYPINRQLIRADYEFCHSRVWASRQMTYISKPTENHLSIEASVTTTPLLSIKKAEPVCGNLARGCSLRKKWRSKLMGKRGFQKAKLCGSTHNLCIRVKLSVPRRWLPAQRMWGLEGEGVFNSCQIPTITFEVIQGERTDGRKDGRRVIQYPPSATSLRRGTKSRGVKSTHLIKCVERVFSSKHSLFVCIGDIKMYGKCVKRA